MCDEVEYAMCAFSCVYFVLYTSFLLYFHVLFFSDFLLRIFQLHTFCYFHPSGVPVLIISS